MSAPSAERCPHCQALLPSVGVAVADPPQDGSSAEHRADQPDTDAWRSTRGIFAWRQGDPPAEVIVRRMRDATRR